MKRIRCPKCENYLTFDETKYTEGQSLVFVCENCKKQFSIRLGKTKMKAPQKEENPDETEYKEALEALRSLRMFSDSSKCCRYRRETIKSAAAA